MKVNKTTMLSTKMIQKRIRFIKEFRKFKRLSNSSGRRILLSPENRKAIYEDSKQTPFDTHYIYHPAWAARILAKTQPNTHIDISSKLDFSTIVSAFIPVEFYDYRPPHISLNNLVIKQIDLLNMPFKDNSVNSISCMHVVEHIGLGRYGDKLNPEGDLQAIHELIRVLMPGGTLLFVAPIGKPKIIFNAHRIYSYDQIIGYFDELSLKEFSLIPDTAPDMGMIKDANKEMANKQRYGCGCFWFTKP